MLSASRIWSSLKNLLNLIESVFVCPGEYLDIEKWWFDSRFGAWFKNPNLQPDWIFNLNIIPETKIAHENPIFPGTYHQNGGFSMAMLVYRSVVTQNELTKTDRI